MGYDTFFWVSGTLYTVLHPEYPRNGIRNLYSMLQAVQLAHISSHIHMYIPLPHSLQTSLIDYRSIPHGSQMEP